MVAASARSAGKTYEESVGDRWKMTTPMPEAVKNLIVMNVNEVEEVAQGVDFVFSAVDMSKEEIREIEDAYAKTETPVVSNNSCLLYTSTSNMRRLDLNIGISYDSDLKRAKEIIMNLLENDASILKDQDRLVVVDQLADSAVCLLYTSRCV